MTLLSSMFWTTTYKHPYHHCITPLSSGINFIRQLMSKSQSRKFLMKQQDFQFQHQGGYFWPETVQNRCIINSINMIVF